jgi:hypothetical protein
MQEWRAKSYFETGPEHPPEAALISIPPVPVSVGVSAAGVSAAATVAELNVTVTSSPSTGAPITSTVPPLDLPLVTISEVEAILVLKV